MKFIFSAEKKIYIVSAIGMIFVSIIIVFVIFDLPIQNLNAKLILDNKKKNSQVLIGNNQESNLVKLIDQSPPVQIIIPVINVDAKIESVGLTSDNAVGVPSTPADVAWYNLGPRPGENGSAVISGHYGRWKDGSGSVFDDLNLLKIDDKIYIKNESGATTTFIVRDIKKYDSSANVLEIFNAKDDKAHLNLITCQGAWNRTTKSFPDRLVVFADKE